MSARGCHASSLGLMPFSGSGFTSMPIGNSKWSGTRLIARGKKSFGAEFKQPWHWHPAFSKDLFTAMFSITIYFANFYFAYSCFRLLPQTWLSFRQSEHKSKEVTRLSGNLWKRLHAYNWCLRPHPRMFNVSHPVNCNLKTLPLLSQSLKVNKTKGTLSKSLIGSWIESRWHWDCLPLQFHSLLANDKFDFDTTSEVPALPAFGMRALLSFCLEFCSASQIIKAKRRGSQPWVNQLKAHASSAH